MTDSLVKETTKAPKTGEPYRKGVWCSSTELEEVEKALYLFYGRKYDIKNVSRVECPPDLIDHPNKLFFEADLHNENQRYPFGRYLFSLYLNELSYERFVYFPEVDKPQPKVDFPRTGARSPEGHIYCFPPFPEEVQKAVRALYAGAYGVGNVAKVDAAPAYVKITDRDKKTLFEVNLLNPDTRTVIGRYLFSVSNDILHYEAVIHSNIQSTSQLSPTKPVSQEKESQMTKKVISLSQEQKDKLLHKLFTSVSILPPEAKDCKHFPDLLEESTDPDYLRDDNTLKTYTRLLRCKKCLTIYGQNKDTSFSALNPAGPDVMKMLWFGKWTKVEVPNSLEGTNKSEDLLAKMLSFLF